MIDTTTLRNQVNEYQERCRTTNHEPTFRGVGIALGISGRTVANVVRGYYCIGKPYTTKPHITRCIDNSDFEVIKGIFSDLKSTKC